MKRSHLIGLSVLVFAGCVSIEKQLASSDPATRAKGQQRAVEYVLDSSASHTERLAVIGKLNDNGTILRLLSECRTPDLYKACLDKLDQQGLYDFLTKVTPEFSYKVKSEDVWRDEKEKGRYALSRLVDVSLLSELYGNVENDRYGGRPRKGMKSQNVAAKRLN